ncbi:MAG: glutamate synthase subunit beta [Myxococcota bacterium]
MGKPTGFIEWPRAAAPKRAKSERLQDWHEISLKQAPDVTRQQAGRCMDCGVPFCHQGCPLGNAIPDFNELIWQDRWKAAFINLTSTNNFPEFTGRLCPAPCEAACVLAINQDPVTIEQVEKEIIERAYVEGWVVPRLPTSRTGRKVAVVGSGPAGLAAAAQLNQAGHLVTVYERDDKPGGLLRYGIPDFKMEKDVIDRRLAVLEAEGIRFRTGVDVGRNPSWRELRDTHDALVIAVGARVPRELDVPGRDLVGVHQAMDYLEDQNRAVADAAYRRRYDAKGQRVIILGGGDTGSDCLGTALRQGAAHVMQVELMPKPPELRTVDNPWPQWPAVFTTSSSQEEGGVRAFALMTKRLTGTDGRLTTLHAIQVQLQRGDDGRTRLVERPGTELELPVDRLILAMGFVGPDTTTLREQLGVALDGRGNVAVNAQFATDVDGVFCAGDARRGASLIVTAISDGRETARHVDAWLAGGRSILPTRGVDLPVGGRL